MADQPSSPGFVVDGGDLEASAAAVKPIAGDAKAVRDELSEAITTVPLLAFGAVQGSSKETDEAFRRAVASMFNDVLKLGNDSVQLRAELLQAASAYAKANAKSAADYTRLVDAYGPVGAMFVSPQTVGPIGGTR